ncbi:GntR family transcriptional regulator [Lentzea sp. DG1S-22]|uniref:GntR family transcriptional regulator n=1 Tax=unclassified Lentzea TaxID=2643253 RepID=UPI001F3943E1|nr:MULTISPECIES: GntR family transcriptional regulator [unclassified Lentzea]MCG8926555.1 GntR family transcriptional regulator [Lentzea sp. CC55]WVH84630.1 GntR family transcriptional regulator [Lentzea sp. DG1S-22]
MKERAAAEIRSAIVRGDLQPGTPIKDVELAERLGLSRTPVREALATLTDEGLVETKPHAYTRVTALEAEPVLDALVVVQTMHSLAVGIAVLREMPAEDIAAMRAANEAFKKALDANDAVAALAADDEFHAVAVHRCGNFAVAATIDRYTPLVRRAEHSRFSSPQARHSVAQHDRIIEACERGDHEQASLLVDENWGTLKEEL